jgi:uncharacterized protein YbaP (TraB family)
MRQRTQRTSRQLKQWIIGFAVFATTACGTAAARIDIAPHAPAPQVLDDVLVTGVRPGPGMWRIAKGGHELWILGTLEPLPKEMSWRSSAVEMQIAASQAVLAPPRVSTDIGFFRGLTLLPSLLRARSSPDHATLEQTLPHDLYIRWLALRVKYLGSGSGSGDEKTRPMLAALDLYTHALDQSGLTSDERVWHEIERIAHDHHVPIEPVTLNLQIKDPKEAIQDLEQIPRAAEIGCLQTTMERLETDLGPMRQRANWWALGDIEALRAASYPDERIACEDAFFSVPALREQFLRAKDGVIDQWLTAADRALEQNAETFAVLPIAELLQADGWLARLRARGYTVEDPH